MPYLLTFLCFLQTLRDSLTERVCSTFLRSFSILQNNQSTGSKRMASNRKTMFNGFNSVGVWQNHLITSVSSCQYLFLKTVQSTKLAWTERVLGKDSCGLNTFWEMTTTLWLLALWRRRTMQSDLHSLKECLPNYRNHTDLIFCKWTERVCYLTLQLYNGWSCLVN